MPLILLAEDDVAVAEVLAQFLKSKGFQVTVVHDGATAAQKAEECRPDLIISDVHMPGLYGPTAFRALPDALIGKTPIIFISGLPEDQVKKVTLLPLTARGRLLRKPVDLAKLEATIAELLAQKPS